MARLMAGGTAADYTILAGDAVTIGAGTGQNAVLVGGIEVTWWNARTGGSQYVDLLDEDGAAVSSLLSSDGADGRALGQIGRVQYPDTVTGAWASAGGGPRVWMPADTSAVAATASADLALLQEDVAGLVENPTLPFDPAWAMDTVTAAGNTFRQHNLTGGPVTLRRVFASIGGDTPSGGSIVFTVYVNGVEVFTAANRPSIAAGARVSTGGTTFAVTAIPADGYMTAEVISAPSPTAGTKLTIQAHAY